MFSARRAVYMDIAQQCVQVAAVKRMGEIDFINKTGLFQLYIVLYLEDLNPIKLGFSDKYSHHSLNFLFFLPLILHLFIYQSILGCFLQPEIALSKQKVILCFF